MEQSEDFQKAIATALAARGAILSVPAVKMFAITPNFVEIIVDGEAGCG